MSDKKKQSKSRSLLSMFFSMYNVYNVCRSFIRHLKIEAYFTLKNLIILLTLSLILVCVVTATWVSLLAILFYGLLQLHLLWYFAAIIVMLINILLLVLLGFFIMKTKKKINFHETTRKTVIKKTEEVS